MSSAKSTAYRVELTDRAMRDLEEIYSYIEAGSSESAARWFEELEALTLTLRKEPQRGLRTPEGKSLFHLLHGNKPHIYRIIYSVQRARKEVLVLHVRHVARSPFQKSDLT